MMEKHKCKRCFRNFSNGRALGGHMRSHVMNLHVPPKPNESPPTVQLSFEAESSSTPSSYSGEEEEEDNKGLCYGLRENPKRSFRVADPEFSFAAAADTGSVILQDRESETESSRNVTRRRSKRDWKLGEFNKKMKLSQHGNRNESESSASDMTTEEDVAFCLMLLSRDSSSRVSKWRQKHKNIREQEDEDDLDLEDEDEEEEEEEDEEEDEESDEYEEMKNKTMKTNKVRGGRYKCETCNRVFRSYQALGGHRASHKKIKLENQRHHEPKSMAMDHDDDDDNVNNNNNNIIIVASSCDAQGNRISNSNNLTSNTKKIHECPVCFRVFASGQALGGHKRTHVLTTVPTTTVTRAAAAAEAVAVAVAAVANSNVAASSSTKLGRESLIDLNLPAPVDDDDVSQFEDSAVSDAECFKPVVKVFPR